MRTEIYFDSNLDSLVIQATGRISYNDLPLLAEQVISHPDFRTNIDKLFDCTNGQLDLSTEELKQIANKYRQLKDVLGTNRRMALVAKRLVDFGMMRQYETFFTADSMVDVRVFKEFADAADWLKTDKMQA